MFLLLAYLYLTILKVKINILTADILQMVNARASIMIYNQRGSPTCAFDCHIYMVNVTFFHDIGKMIL